MNTLSFPVVHRTTKLTHKEINQMSREVGVHWDGLGGLMDIPYVEREEIRLNFVNYPKLSSRAGQMFTRFNKREDFCRLFVGKCLEELGRHDVKGKMFPMDDEVFYDLRLRSFLIHPKSPNMDRKLQNISLRSVANRALITAAQFRILTDKVVLNA